ncbi:DUF6868 family protein [Sneathiella chinensis]|uniref:DUF6868 domain-containing protein n=1 Tax=Sneathiella chinensis TaxID=349750 RepID=A0ABQ5U156_9PROT|nr:hypothetical protein [Sneathiella chinensis]GLQ05927.1 hypothetical protein GCM10007924_11480 [Sneathiella chinensis]
MTPLETVTALLGWSALINIGLLLVATLCLMFMRGWIVPLHSRMFGANEEQLALVYVQYLGTYKIAILMLNLVPYIALKIISG